MSDHGEEEEERPLCPASSGQSEIFTGFTGKPGSSATKVTEKLWSSPADLWLWAGSPLCRPPQGGSSRAAVCWSGESTLSTGDSETW
ncbi:hypothetical protein Q5P01_025693 [Channa striata]|uniref:Uncharacterized protein n=1 Tax=Channa striata TaxID=64152 RepID=A0AA88LPS6_CHASR|nr:hypothetical protein Q5P01_025693 [Channa striata]